MTPAGLRERWALATFGARHPRRRVAALAALGTVTGAGEAAIILLLVAIASGGGGHRLPALVPDGDPWTLAGVALGVVALVALAHLASARVAARAGADAQRSVQGMLMDAYLAAPYAAQGRSRTGDLQNLIASSRMIASGTSNAARTVSTAANLAIVVGAAVAVDVRATAALLAAVVLSVVIARAFQDRVRRRSRETVEATAALAADVTETTAVAAELRVFGVTGQARERLGERLERSTRLTQEVQLAMGATPPLTRDATVAVTVIGMAVLVTSADIPLAVLGATVVLVMRALAHAQGLSSAFHLLAERAANAERVREQLAEWRPRLPAGTRPCPRIGTMELRGVSFAHRPEEGDALRDVTLRIERGEQLGIVGPTGAGKSTLAAVVLGLLPPDSGEVLVDGVPLAELDPADWHRLTAWVGQDPRLVSGTVRDNIRFLRPHVTDAAAEQAARDAALAPDLGDWEDGLDRDVGPAGAALSGGQRQRIALARALAGEPHLVVLDEPTSALDAHAEAAVRATLESLRGRASVVVIAHRLSTIRACDRVAVMRDGRLVEVGRPDEVAAGGSYLAEALALAGEGR